MQASMSDEQVYAQKQGTRGALFHRLRIFRLLGEPILRGPTRTLPGFNAPPGVSAGTLWTIHHLAGSSRLQDGNRTVASSGTITDMERFGDPHGIALGEPWS